MTTRQQPVPAEQEALSRPTPALAFLCFALLPVLGYCVWLWLNAPRLPWHGRLFNSADLTGESLSTKALQLRQRGKKFSPLPGVNPKRFSARWTTCLLQHEPESVTFHLAADDGARLRVGESLVLDEWRKGRISAGKTVQLGAGLHRIEVEHFQAGGVALLQLNVGWGGVAPGPIPPDRLRAPIGPDLRCLDGR